MEKIANSRVVTITKNGFAFEMIFIMFKFLLNIRKLSIKLIFSSTHCRIKILVSRHNRFIVKSINYKSRRVKKKRRLHYPFDRCLANPHVK